MVRDGSYLSGSSAFDSTHPESLSTTHSCLWDNNFNHHNHCGKESCYTKSHNIGNICWVVTLALPIALCLATRACCFFFRRPVRCFRCFIRTWRGRRFAIRCFGRAPTGGCFTGGTGRTTSASRMLVVGAKITLYPFADNFAIR